MVKNLLKFSMQSISIIEPIKIRLKGYKTLFRRALPLEKHEKAILGLINQNNGSYEFIELGTVLGFAVADNPELQVRKDVAEIQLFESYLENLKSNHLIEYNSQSIQLTYWGEKAINDDLKYSFYSGNIQIPEFFDIELSNEASNFTFKEIGVEVRLTNEQNLNKAWDLAELEAPDHNLVNQFHLNRLNKNDAIIFDSIEPLSNLGLIETDLEFTESNSSIDVLYESKLHEQLSKEINKTPNKLRADYLKLKINCKRLVESKEDFLIEDLTDFVSIIDWSDVLERPNIVWDSSSIGLLENFQVNWNLISSKAPISTIQDAIDNYLDKFDWLELTNRLNLEFILANIDQYPWDVDVLTDRITLDDFKDHFSGIVKLPGIDLHKFYEQVDKDFIRQNFNQLPNITSYISTNDSSELLEYILEYSDAPWNHTLVSQKLSLTEIEANFSDLKQNLNFEILIERFISDSYDCDVDTFEEVISLASLSDDNKILNRFSNCDLSLTKLQILENHELIYWGNDVAPGFELNPFQNWSIDTVRTFENKWGYSEAIKYLSGNISDSEIIEKINFEWDFAAISQNNKLIDNLDFVEKWWEKLDYWGLISNINKRIVIENLKFFLDKSYFKDYPDLLDAVSSELNLRDVLTFYKKKPNSFDSIYRLYNWDNINNNTIDDEYLKNKDTIVELILEGYILPELIDNISLIYSINFILENPNVTWNWQIVTERAIVEDLVDDETLVAYLGYWDWKVLIEKYFDPEDLQIDGRLSEIAALISQAPDEVSEKSWKFITDIYPSHSIWSAINTTDNIDLFKWDWNSISSSNKISLDLNTLNRYKERINWSLLSSNLFLNGFFRNDREIYGTRKQWENHVLSYLSKFSELWDFKELSKLGNITRSESIVNYFRQKWDWDILSSEKSKLLTTKNKEGVLFNKRLFQKFERFINFEVISNRKDAFLDFEILNKFNDKNWDWNALSSNESLKIEKEILLNELLDKPWDWKILSNNPAITFSNEDLLLLRDKGLDWNHFSSKEWLANSTILELSNKTWDWHAISSSRQLIYDKNLLRIFSNKEVVNWDNILSSNNLHCNEKTIGLIASSIKDSKELWSTLSSNQNLSFENEILLDEYKEFWDWDILIKSNKIDVNSELVLRKYQGYLNWTTLSSVSSFYAEISVLNEFKYLLDWKHVTIKIALSDQILENFKSFIDWKVLSRYSDFSGQLPLIKKYSDFIDFEGLENNPSIDYETNLYIENYLKENIHKRFVYNLKKQHSNWAGFVYHFTHLENAIDIIKNRQILSRNKATKDGDFSDAAGDVVNRRHDAHDYARFYFRPQTPTQFYNECLGKDYLSDKYDQALNLGLPKCPIPVFFKFSIDEVFNNQFDKCYISNGNLQTNWARIGTVSEMYNLFDFNDVYSTIQSTSDGDWRTYINKSQQEFLVRDQFDFSAIHNYEILVRNRSDLFQLKHLLKDYPNVVQKIRIADYDDDIYLNNNKEIEYNLEGNTVSVSTNYNGNGSRSGYFEMEIEEGTYRINSGQVLSKTGNTIRFYPGINIEFESEPCLKVTFKDQVTNKKPWQILNYCKKDNKYLNDNEISVIEEIIQINYLLNIKFNFNELSKILDEQDYNPYRVYKRSFGKSFVFEPGIKINTDKLEYFLCSNLKLENLDFLLPFKYLKAVWAYDCMDFNEFIKNSRPKIEKHCIATVFGDMDEDTILTNSDCYFALYFNLRLLSDHYAELNNGENYIRVFKKYNEFRKLFETKVRHYILEDHTQLVLNQFHKYFEHKNTIKDWSRDLFNYYSDDWFKVLLTVHDIGKPKSSVNGNTKRQYEHTLEIIEEISHALPFSHIIDMEIFKYVLSNDVLGDYFQYKKTLLETAGYFTSNERINPVKLLYIHTVYYQCDTAAYTADAGGYKFLEHLFSYESGQKVFDEEAGMLRFSDKYREMYNRLKDEILKWQ